MVPAATSMYSSEVIEALPQCTVTLSAASVAPLPTLWALGGPQTVAFKWQKCDLRTQLNITSKYHEL